MQHQYHVQYHRLLNQWSLGDVTVNSELNRRDFVQYLARDGYWIDDKTWIAPGAIQQVNVTYDPNPSASATSAETGFIQADRDLLQKIAVTIGAPLAM